MPHLMVSMLVPLLAAHTFAHSRRLMALQAAPLIAVARLSLLPLFLGADIFDVGDFILESVQGTNKVKIDDQAVTLGLSYYIPGA